MHLLYLLHFVPGRTTIVSLIYAWNSRKQPSGKRCACAPIALPLFDFCFRLLAGWSKVLKLPHNLHRSHVAKKSLHSLLPHSSWYFFSAVVIAGAAASTAYVHVYGFQFSLIKPVRVQFAQGCFIVARVLCHASREPRKLRIFHNDFSEIKSNNQMVDLNMRSARPWW